jgi:hypothetical protein
MGRRRLHHVRSGGGANATGSYSATASVVPCPGSPPDADDPSIAT